MRLNKTNKELIIDQWKVDFYNAPLKIIKEELLLTIKNHLETKVLHKEIAIVKDNPDLRQYFITHSYCNLEDHKHYDAIYSLLGKYNLSILTYVSNDNYSAYDIDDNSLPEKVIINHLNDKTKLDNKLNDIQSVINACSTAKKLIDLVPDLEKYIPKGAVGTQMIDQSVLNRVKSQLKG